MFVYGRDIFLLFIGTQLVSASQAVLVSRVLGLDAAAAWSVCTRVFMVMTQLVYRVFDFSCAALAEMIVRKEMERLLHRFKSIVVLSASLGMIGAVIIAACNSAFVAVWTGGRIQWPVVNDSLLAVWLVVCMITHAHVGLVGQTKDFRLLSYVFLLEGVFFVSGSLWALGSSGLPGMLAVSVAGTMLFSMPYALWRTGRLFQVPFLTVAVRWIWPSLRLGAMMGPVAVIVWLATHSLPSAAQFVVNGAVLGLSGAVLFFRFGLEESLTVELLGRCPAWLKPVLSRLCGRNVIEAIANRASAGGESSGSATSRR